MTLELEEALKLAERLPEVEQRALAALIVADVTGTIEDCDEPGYAPTRGDWP